ALLAVGLGGAVVQNLENGTSFMIGGSNERIREAGFTVDGERIVTTSEDRIASVWNARSGERIHKVDLHSARLEGLAIGHKGNLIGTSGGNGTVVFWNAGTGRIVSVWEDPDRSRANCIAFSPSGELAAVAALNGLYIVDPETGLTLLKITGEAYDVQ